MRYPSLVRDRDCKQKIDVIIFSDKTGEDGEPVEILRRTLRCNYQEVAKQREDPNHNIVTITGIAYFNGDVFPEVPNLSNGYVDVAGQTKKIFQGQKARNPDGTINYTRLELK